MGRLSFLVKTIPNLLSLPPASSVGRLWRRFRLYTALKALSGGGGGGGCWGDGVGGLGSFSWPSLASSLGSQRVQWELSEKPRRLPERRTLAAGCGRLVLGGTKTRVERRAPTAGMGGGGCLRSDLPARVLIQHRRPAASAHQTILLLLAAERGGRKERRGEEPAAESNRDRIELAGRADRIRAESK